MTKSIRKKYKYKSKKRSNKRRNKKTKRLKNRKSKATNKYTSHKGGGFLPVAAAAAIGTAVGAGATAYASYMRVEGDLGTIIQKFHLYKKKYYSWNSLRECILYVVNHGGKYRFYFDNGKTGKNIGEQLTDKDVGGSSPPGGNIFGWSIPSVPVQGLIEEKYVPARIELFPHRDMVHSSRVMKTQEYTGFNGENYKVPIIFGINTHKAYSGKSSEEITNINNELLGYLNKGIADEDCEERATRGATGEETSEATREETSEATREETSEATGEAMREETREAMREETSDQESAWGAFIRTQDDELVKNRDIIYSIIEKKEEGNVRLRELINKINRGKATRPEIAEKDKLEADLKKMDVKIRKLKEELTWQ